MVVHFIVLDCPHLTLIDLIVAVRGANQGKMGDFVDFGDGFDIDEVLNEMEEETGSDMDEEQGPSDFQSLVVSLCTQRVGENELIGRMETEEEVFQAVMGSPEIAAFMVSTGFIDSADDHATANDSALKSVSQHEETRAKETIASNEVRIIALDDSTTLAHDHDVRNLVLDSINTSASGGSPSPVPEHEEFFKFLAKHAMAEGGDLRNLKESYYGSNSGMPLLVAVVETRGDDGKPIEEVVGCVGLTQIGAYDPIDPAPVPAAGSSSGNTEQRQQQQQHYCCMSRLAVKRYYRRHGVGSKLVAAIEEKARSLGFVGVVANVLVSGTYNADAAAGSSSSAAIALLQKTGYALAGEGKVVPVEELLSLSKKQRKKMSVPLMLYQLKRDL